MKKMKKLLSLILVFGLVLTSGALSFADVRLLAVDGDEAPAGCECFCCAAGDDCAADNVSCDHPDCTYCNPTQLYEWIYHLSTAFGPRVLGTPAEWAAGEYIKGEYEKMGVFDEVHIEKLPLQDWTGWTNYSGIIDFEGKRPNMAGLVRPNEPVGSGAFTGLYHDFGVYSIGTTTAHSFTLPSEADVTAAGGKIYGTLALYAPQTAANPMTTANLDMIIDSILANYASAELTGLYTTRYRLPEDTYNRGRSSATVMPTAKTTTFAMTLGAWENLAEYLKSPGSGPVKTINHKLDYTNTVYAKLEARDKENPDLVITMSGHHDSVVHAAGTDDDLSGVVAIMETAKRMGRYYKLCDETPGMQRPNIELIFAATGAEEGPSAWDGADYLMQKVLKEGKGPIAIEYALDCIGLRDKEYVDEQGRIYRAEYREFEIGVFERENGSMSADGYFTGVNPGLKQNLASWLLLDHASEVNWQDTMKGPWLSGGTDMSDHQLFGTYGLESASIQPGRNSGGGSVYMMAHTYGDNMDGYSYRLHATAMSLLENGLMNAVKKEATKRADITIGSGTATLNNAGQLFKTFSRVDVEMVNSASGASGTVTFLRNGAYAQNLPEAVASNPSIVKIVGGGTGVADYTDPIRSLQYQDFSTNLYWGKAENIVETTMSVISDPVSGVSTGIRIELSKDVGELDPYYNFNLSGASKGTITKISTDPPVYELAFSNYNTHRMANNNTYPNLVVSPWTGAWRKPVVLVHIKKDGYMFYPARFEVGGIDKTPLTVSFYSNGAIGGLVPNAQTIEYGQVISPLNAGSLIPPIGMLFLGWNTSPDGDGVAYEPGSLMPSRDLALYAQWVEDPKYVNAKLSVPAVSGIEGDVEYTLSIKGEKNVLNLELEFEIDSSMLAGKGLTGLNGFTAISEIFWSYAGGSVWKGTVTLGYPAGDSEGFMPLEYEDVAKFAFSPRALGDAAMKLTGFRAVGLEGDVTQYLASAIAAGTATTNIDQLVYSKYDLNKDNKVDALDLGIMLLYCGFDCDSPSWATLVKVNDSKGKPVTASMCDVNCDGVIDMLDLLDLFIHYTK